MMFFVGLGVGTWAEAWRGQTCTGPQFSLPAWPAKVSRSTYPEYTCSSSFREKLHSALHTLDNIHP